MNTGNSLRRKSIAILGSTGSIGTQALEIVAGKPDHFRVAALSARKSWKLLAEQANKFKPNVVLLCDETNRSDFEAALGYKPSRIFYGQEALTELAVLEEADLILNSLVGFSGFKSTYSALKAGKKVALANKESLVVGGELLSGIPGFYDNLIPVDSEHSAMLQCLVGEDKNMISKIVITASGGPFRNFSTEMMKKITVEDALKHPNWDMGNKITIDSSTMMNKGLEIIEAHWLFGIGFDRIEPVIHPQSIIHSIIEFSDGSSKAQLGPPDMKAPILYAMSWPDRIDYNNPVLDYTEAFSMTFEPVDHNRFPCIKLATESAEAGGTAPCIMNAANEIAVDRFLKKEISYIQIPEIIEQSLLKLENNKKLSPEVLSETDRETRSFAESLLS